MTGFYMMGTLAVKRLIQNYPKCTYFKKISLFSNNPSTITDCYKIHKVPLRIYRRQKQFFNFIFFCFFCYLNFAWGIKPFKTQYILLYIAILLTWSLYLVLFDPLSPSDIYE